MLGAVTSNLLYDGIWFPVLVEYLATWYCHSALLYAWKSSDMYSTC